MKKGLTMQYVRCTIMQGLRRVQKSSNLAFYNVLVLGQSSSQICQIYTINVIRNTSGLTV